MDMDKVETREDTHFDQSKLNSIAEISNTIRHDPSGYSVRGAMAQQGEALVKLMQEEGGNQSAEVIEARGGFGTLGMRESAQDNVATTAQNNATASAQLASKALNLAKSLSYGGPAGVFDTVNDLKNAFPSGDSRIYVVKADGKWYYYKQGGGWTAGLTFQGTEIGDSTVTRDKVAPSATYGTVYTTGKAPNFDTINKTFTISQYVNVIYSGSKQISLTSVPYTLDISKNGFILLDTDTKTLSVGNAPSGSQANYVILGGNVNGNYWLNGNYSINGLSSDKVVNAPFYSLYSYGKGVNWNITDKKIGFDGVVVNFGTYTSGGITKEFAYTADVNYIYFNVDTQAIEIQAAPLNLAGSRFMLGWFKESSKSISLNIPDTLINVTPAVGVDDYVTGVDSFIALGDSITFGFGAGDPASRNYTYQISKELGITAYNEGVSNATVQNRSNDDDISFVNRSKTIDFARADTTIIFGGTNDFAQNLPIGEIDDTDEKTFCGALNNVIKNIYTSKPNAKILMITPSWRARINDANVYVDVEKNANSKGLYLRDYVEAVINIAQKYHLPVLDLYHTFNVNELNYKRWLADGLHPNNYGHDKLSSIIAKFLARN